ncbi:MAG: class I SAM-dependent methyltransferase [Planctomycetales bacterium]|nr:class I SAM-dependent methyltransferase [Planctomycetales bacterium]
MTGDRGVIEHENDSVDLVWPADGYQLLDFGDGRKLERFGGVIVDRVCPAAERAKKMGHVAWATADIRLNHQGKPLGRLPTDLESWEVKLAGCRFQLKLTPFGHVGIFPEHVRSWDWLGKQLSVHRGSFAEPARVLNLFGYTGAATLLLASAGAAVVHVDASAPAVKWARSNAEKSGLADKSIRWIVDDARKFVARELRRGNTYDFVVLDPPTYGHGPGGTRWDIQQHLPDLLSGVVSLLNTTSSAVVLTSHSARPDLDETEDLLERSLRARSRITTGSTTGRMYLSDQRQRRLDAGFFIRNLSHT